MIRINLGSGHFKLAGWVNVDLDRGSSPEVIADLAGALPFLSGAANFMHTEDFIDQLTLSQAAAFLRECHRILKPGGVIRVLTPDVEQLANLYLNDPEQLKSLWRANVELDLELGTAAEILNLGMRFAGHTFLYDAETFAALAVDCGFGVEQVRFGESRFADLQGLDLRSPDNAISLYHDCIKV